MLATEPQIIERYVKTGRVKLVFRDVLNHNERSERASEAAACAGKQGKFWEMHGLLFQEQPTLWAESLAVSKELKFQWGLAWSLEDFARIAALSRQNVLALHFGGAAQALREAIGLPLPQPEQTELDYKLESARQALGTERSMLTWTEGRSMPVDQALAEIAEMLVL